MSAMQRRWVWFQSVITFWGMGRLHGSKPLQAAAVESFSEKRSTDLICLWLNQAMSDRISYQPRYIMDGELLHNMRSVGLGSFPRYS